MDRAFRRAGERPFLTKSCLRAALPLGIAALAVVVGCEKKSPVAPPPSVAQPEPAPQVAPSQAIKPGGLPKAPPSSPPAISQPAAPTVTTPPATAPRPVSPASSTVASFLGLTGPKPATWIEQPVTSPMRVANYTIPGADGSGAAELVVFHFENDRGTAELNIERWTNQFRSPSGEAVAPTIDKFEADAMPVTLVTLEGEYMGMGATDFTPNQLFLGAIVEAPVGKVYFRLVGPKPTVNPEQAAFTAMLKGLRKTDPAK